MKLLRTICVAGLALCLATSVYAGTQSVKISGDITMRGLIRDDFDLDHNHAEGMPGVDNANLVERPLDNTNSLYRANQRTAGKSDWDTYFMTTTEVQIDADLTDNVSAVIRLYNQRDWNVAQDQATAATSQNFNARANEFSVGVDLAYIELKEFLYSPLTLRIGRQDLWFGKGFIVGANRRDPAGNINAQEYTCMNSFDAIRATLDYDPWTIDAVAAKIWENTIGSKDDIDLFGVNIGYIFDVYNAEMEAYWFFKDDAGTAPSQLIKSHNTIHTLGIRGSADPIENWTIAGEAAYQWGSYVGFLQQSSERARSAWAVDISAECRYFKDMFAWKPVIGAEWIYYGGDSNHDPQTSHTDGTWTGWDPMYRGKYDSKIREWFGTYYWSAQGYNTFLERGTRAYNPEASFTNQHQFIVMGSLEPTDSLTIDARFLAFWQASRKSYDMSGMQGAIAREIDWGLRSAFVGTELDLEANWDYTEDVSFGLLTAWFFPGTMYGEGSDDVATDVVATCSLSF